jgi:hypothetical protein
MTLKSEQRTTSFQNQINKKFVAAESFAHHLVDSTRQPGAFNREHGRPAKMFLTTHSRAPSKWSLPFAGARFHVDRCRASSSTDDARSGRTAALEAYSASTP